MPPGRLRGTAYDTGPLGIECSDTSWVLTIALAQAL